MHVKVTLAVHLFASMMKMNQCCMALFLGEEFAQHQTSQDCTQESTGTVLF